MFTGRVVSATACGSEGREDDPRRAQRQELAGAGSIWLSPAAPDGASQRPQHLVNAGFLALAYQVG